MTETQSENVYRCATCGVVTFEEGHLCSPQPVEGGCSYCGQPVENTRHMCKPMREKLEYVCQNCGRPAEAPHLVCHPNKMPG